MKVESQMKNKFQKINPTPTLFNSDHLVNTKALHIQIQPTLSTGQHQTGNETTALYIPGSI